MDVALVANTFHGVEDQVPFVTQAREVVRPSGRFVVNWQDLPNEETTVGGEGRGPPEDLRMSVEEAREIVGEKFGDVKVVELPPYHFEVVGE